MAGFPGLIVNPKCFTAATTDGSLKPGDFAFETASEYWQDACFVSKTGSNLLGIVKHGFMPYQGRNYQHFNEWGDLCGCAQGPDPVIWSSSAMRSCLR